MRATDAKTKNDPGSPNIRRTFHIPCSGRRSDGSPSPPWSQPGGSPRQSPDASIRSSKTRRQQLKASMQGVSICRQHHLSHVPKVAASEVMHGSDLAALSASPQVLNEDNRVLIIKPFLQAPAGEMVPFGVVGLESRLPVGGNGAAVSPRRTNDHGLCFR